MILLEVSRKTWLIPLWGFHDHSFIPAHIFILYWEHVLSPTFSGRQMATFWFIIQQWLLFFFCSSFVFFEVRNKKQDVNEGHGSVGTVRLGLQSRVSESCSPCLSQWCLEVHEETAQHRYSAHSLSPLNQLGESKVPWYFVPWVLPFSS